MSTLCLILFLLMLCIVPNLLFTTVDIFIYGNFEYGRNPELYTLYFDKILVGSKLSWSAKDILFLRFFRLPYRICILSQKDSIRIQELRSILQKKESKLDLEMVKQFPHQVIYVKGNIHYILYLYGTTEAVEIFDLFNKYMFPGYSLWRLRTSCCPQRYSFNSSQHWRKFSTCAIGSW